MIDASSGRRLQALIAAIAVSVVVPSPVVSGTVALEERITLCEDSPTACDGADLRIQAGTVCANDTSVLCSDPADCLGAPCVALGSCENDRGIACSSDQDCVDVGGSCVTQPDPGEFGFATAMGDLNDDGIDDLVVGDPQANSVSVFLGTASPNTKYDGLGANRGLGAGQADVILVGPPDAESEFGFSVAVGAERICEDKRTVCNGVCECAGQPLLVGAPATQTANALGRAYLIPGDSLSGLSGPVSIADVPAVETINGLVDGDQTGYAVALGPLTDSDGLEINLVISARNLDEGKGAVYVTEPGVFSLDDADDYWVLRGASAADGVGEAVTLGDFLNADARKELAIGAVGIDPDTCADGCPGKVYALAMPPVMYPDGGSVSLEQQADVACLLGETDNGFFGFSLAAGNYVGGGSTADELAVAAIYADRQDPQLFKSGALYLYTSTSLMGQLGQPCAAPGVVADHVIEGSNNWDQFGFAIATGNLSGATGDDLLVSARRHDREVLPGEIDEIDEGAVYVIFGGDPNFDDWPDDTDCGENNDNCNPIPEKFDAMLFGGNYDLETVSTEELGFALAAGDFDADGVDDICSTSVNHGRAYLVSLVNNDGDEWRNIRDCDDADLTSYPGADEVCDGNDNDCDGNIPVDETDLDLDDFVVCSPWDDTQGDQPQILGGADCDDVDASLRARATYPGAAPNDDVDACMKDLDEDDWGDEEPVITGVVAGTDCDDDEPTLNPETLWYADTDLDTFGDPNSSQMVCEQPEDPHVRNSEDCDDTSATTKPGAAPNDDPMGDACMKDDDEDEWGDATPPAGVDPGTDCNDDDAALNALTTWYPDTDVDGFGDPMAVPVVSCEQPDGYVLDMTDCDDLSPTASATFPGAAPLDSEFACMKDGDDDLYGDSTPPFGVTVGSDCNDDLTNINPETMWYADADADGFGDPNVTVTQCTAPPDFVLDNTDCDDTSATAAQTFPGAAPNDDAMACLKDFDGDDWGDDMPPAGVTPGTDCDDDDVAISPDTIWYADTDADTFGDPNVTQMACTQPANHVADDTDCDDTSATAAQTFPGAAPNDDAMACLKDFDGDDWGDDTPPAGVTPGTDCDDDDAAISPDTIWYADTDADTFGDPNVTQMACTQPANHVADDTDCDDTSATAAQTFPGAAPNDDAMACLKDFDGDDWGDDTPPAGVTPGTDCDDTSATAAQTFPGAAPNDDAMACLKDFDGDDWGDDTPPAGVTPGTDCDDDDAAISPDTIWYADIDADTFGDPNVSVTQCTAPPDFVLDDTDCDDTSATAAQTFPGAAPNDDAMACLKDFDGDDWGDDMPPAGVTPGTDCDDDDAAISPDTIWYADTDADTFGDPNVTQTACTQPANHVADDTDCDDTSATAAQTFPGAAPNDDAMACLKDFDGDDWGDDMPPAGVTPGTDCDDDDAAISPDTIWYADTDADTFGDPNVTQTACTQPANHVADDTDCDDTSATAAQTFPGAAPNDDAMACLKDFDGDDWGDDMPPAGVTPGTDCDDDDAAISPDTIWYADTDADTFGDPNVTQTACTQPANHVADDTDCDDTSATAAQTFPGAAPNDDAMACLKDFDGDDWGDDMPPAGVTPGTDCDDDDAAISPDTIWYADTDGDGFGDPNVSVTQCTAPPDFVLDDTDCDDTSATAAQTFPGAAPNDDALACMKDFDGDDWGDDFGGMPPPGIDAGTDCDDNDPDVFPGQGCGPPPPLPVSSSLLMDDTRVHWGPVPGAAAYHLYRGDLTALLTAGVYTQDPATTPSAARFCMLSATEQEDTYVPAGGEAVFYLVTSDNGAAEGSLGEDGQGQTRPNENSCR